MAFSPVVASEQIISKYKRYLDTIFQIKDKCYSEGFQSELKKIGAFTAGPYLDVTDTFVKSETMLSLINQDIISKGFKNIHMPLDRPLYKHQMIAINKIFSGQNVVVSTGTGSGKTECFLIPILNYLCRQREEGTLDSGVRALIIYPMNALANDQIERLRALLTDCPSLTYGSYTGQTKEKYEDALFEYKQLNSGEVPPVNELISREQMKVSPPHILITNYAMLEYLMVRPADSVFFEQHLADKWRFIILDEAHVYNGSTGIEVSMLLRRLKAKLQNDTIQYVLTSATLGSENDNKEVASFAENLCASPFTEENVIRAYRERVTATHDLQKIPFKFYSIIAHLIEIDETNNSIFNCLSGYLIEPQDRYESVYEALYDIVLHDENYLNIRALLAKPMTLDDLSKELMVSQQEIADFVTVASRCDKNGDRLFDARYHMLLRATESVFITLNPSNKVFLNRKNEHVEFDGNKYKLFEIATCSSCHSIYLIGQEKNSCLEQWSGSDDSVPRALFLLADFYSDTDDDHTLEDEHLETEEYEICAECGFLRRQGSNHICAHYDKQYVRLFKVKVMNESGDLTKCLSCENTNNTGILKKFYTGQEAVTSVIGTSLFEALPSYKIITETHAENDDSGFGFSEAFETRTEQKEAKQFIAFSDNRQAAAFYASYFSQTYKGILYKRLIIETMKVCKIGHEGRSIDNFIEDLTAIFERCEIASQKSDDPRKEAWKAVLADVVDNNGITSLCRMGLLGLSIDAHGISGNPNYGLSADEVHKICSVFALGMMADAAVDYKVNLNKSDKDFFTHNGVEYSYTLSDSNQGKWKRSFIPTKSHLINKRLDYLTRVLAAAGHDVDRTKGVQLLEAIWNRIFCKASLVKYFESGYKLDSSKIIISKPDTWFTCPKCKKQTPLNVKGVCPSYKCDGKLESTDPSTVLAKNHYYQMYQSLDIRDLRVVEHTAQLDKETAFEYQKKFKRKEIDVLSCSTTFEMGVDVGTLETVFMRNMPPSPANYAQRAGRAGRSKHSAAFALTFCTKSNHDFSFFRTPEKMIRGRIDPPKFIVENEKIAIRHLFASAFSFFWKKYPDFFASTEKIIENSAGDINGVDMFCQYLYSRPTDLSDFLNRFLPESLSLKFDVNHFGWIRLLLNEDPNDPGILRKAVAEYLDEVGKLDQALDLAGRYDDTKNLKERIKLYKRERILEFLSRKNVLPKYGFPVDTVEMTIIDKTNKTKLGLQLQRDLSMAISEYAPGSQVVANGNLITSRYIRKVPNMSWKMYDYVRCSICNTLNIEQNTGNDTLSEMHSCKLCDTSFEGRSRNTFIIPEFGFEADGDKIEKPGLKKPERTYRGDIAYIGYKNIIELKPVPVGKSIIELGINVNDELAVINESGFYVCSYCGYTDLDEKAFTKSKRMRHKNSSGYWCTNDKGNFLKRHSLGYKFKTDVTQIYFIKPDISTWEAAYSILQGILKGACSYLNIEQSDIAGCVQYFFNHETNRPNFALILYDTTPGGAGHIKRINGEAVLSGMLREALAMTKDCDCGGEIMDSSCYSCLRSYRNQKYHDILQRGYVVNFLRDVLS